MGLGGRAAFFQPAIFERWFLGGTVVDLVRDSVSCDLPWLLNYRNIQAFRENGAVCLVSGYSSCGVRTWFLVHVFRLVDGQCQLTNRTFRRPISFVVVCCRGHLCPFVVPHDPQSNRRLASNIPVWPSDHLSGGLRCFGWTSKGAIIQVKKGINIRVVNFSPNNI